MARIIFDAISFGADYNQVATNNKKYLHSKPSANMSDEWEEHDVGSGV